MRNTGHIIKAALGGLAVSAAVLAMAAPAASMDLPHLYSPMLVTIPTHLKSEH